MLDYRNQMVANHILTIEDPVEYVFTPKKCIFNQREVGNDTHAFHDALRNAMRQAPDCILIGEIRDQETMRMALTYALSGHLCLATLHANNSYQAMNRVISFFPLEVRPMLLQDLSVSLKAIISQRLVKTVDGKRTPAVEVLLNSRNVAEAIEKGEVGEVKEMMEKSMSPGSQTFEQDLFRLVRQGKISTDEALANADSATNLGLLLGNSGIMPAMAERTKGVAAPAKGGGPSFSDFKISEEPSEPRFGG
jgi:twitching motility protein PilU